MKQFCGVILSYPGKTIRTSLLVALCGAGLTACGGDPEETSAASLTAAFETWQEAEADDRLDRRLKDYEKAIKAAEQVLERYPDTEAGQRLSRHGVSNGVNLKAWREAHDSLEARLPCIQQPDAACLAEYAIVPASAPGAPRSRNGEIQPAINAACAGSAQRAIEALSKYEANGQTYRENLVQTAMMAANCGADDVVARLVATAVDSDNSTSQMRVRNLAQIMATNELRPGWAHTADAMVAHVDAGNLPEQQAANGLAAAMEAYAGAGRPEEALAMYRRVAEDMGYRVQLSGTVTELLAHGGADVALAEPFRKQTFSSHNYEQFDAALHKIMADAGLTGTTAAERASGRFEALVDYDFRSDPQDVLVPLEDESRRAALKARLEDFRRAVAAAIEAGENRPINSLSFAEAQYLIALVYLRLDEPDAAAAVVQGVKDIPPPPRYETYKAEPYDVVYWLAVGELDKALAASRSNYRQVNDRLAQEFGQAGRADDAQAVIGHLMNAASQQHYGQQLTLAYAEGLIEAGKAGEAMPLIVSLRTEYRNSEESDRVFQALVRALAAGKDFASLENLDGSTTVGARSEDRIAFLSAKAAGLIESGNEKAAREALETLYGYAETAEPSERSQIADILRSSGNSGPHRAFVMAPARVALDGGMIDLGLDYYERAGRWNAAPLVAVARNTDSQSERTKLLTAAFDTNEAAFGQTAWGVLQSLGEE